MGKIMQSPGCPLRLGEVTNGKGKERTNESERAAKRDRA